MTSVNSTTSTSSTSSYSYLQYKNKIGGLVSGMDIDSIMEKLMKAESAQMEKLQQQKQKYEWKRDAYREVNTNLNTFQQDLFDNYGLQGKWNSKTVSVSNSAISATATSSASGTLNISEAKMATAGSKVVSTMANSATADSTIASLGLSDGSFEIQAVNEKGEYTTKTITYKATEKLSDVMSRINSSGVGVTAVVSGSSLSLTATVEGTVDGTGAINISKDDNGLFKALGVLSTQTGSVTAGGTEGSKGYIVANGVKIEGTSNNYSVTGYQLTVNKNINIDENGNSVVGVDATTKVSSTTDTDTIIDKVKEFVNTYNGLIKDLNTRVTEKKNVDYDPLTDAQKAEMTTDQITKWEVKSKAGLLKGDSTINSVLSNMRTTLSQYGQTSTDSNGNTVYGNGSGDTLAKIGITTSSTWSDNGKLVIDEAKLSAALEEDPDIVSRIFTGDRATGAEGIVSKLRTTAQNAVKTINNTAGSDSSTSELTYSIGVTISSLDDKIDDWKDRLKGIEERYWNQFSAMETAIQKANNQSSIFSS